MWERSVQEGLQEVISDSVGTLVVDSLAWGRLLERHEDWVVQVQTLRLERRQEQRSVEGLEGEHRRQEEGLRVETREGKRELKEHTEEREGRSLSRWYLALPLLVLGAGLYYGAKLKR